MTKLENELILKGLNMALEAVRRTDVGDGPKWPEDRPGVWLAALEACDKVIVKLIEEHREGEKG